MAERPLPTTIEGEKESGDWEKMSSEEQEKTKTRHRSVAQLKRHDAEVTEEGRLRATENQMERARREMERDLRARLESARGRLGQASSLEDEASAAREIAHCAGGLAESQRTREAQERRRVEAAEEQRRREEEERLQFVEDVQATLEEEADEERDRQAEAGRGERIVLGEVEEQAAGGVRRFVENVRGVFRQWGERMGTLLERARALGVVAWRGLAAGLDLPVWLIRERVLSAKEARVKEHEEQAEGNAEAYSKTEAALREYVQKEIEKKQEQLSRSIEIRREATLDARREIDDRYGERSARCASEKAKEILEGARQAETNLARNMEASDAQWYRSEVAVFEAGIWRKYDSMMRSHLERYASSTSEVVGRLDRAVVVRDRWQERAEKSRAKKQKLAEARTALREVIGGAA